MASRAGPPRGATTALRWARKLVGEFAPWCELLVVLFGAIEIGARHLRGLAGEVQTFAATNGRLAATDDGAGPDDEEVAA